MILASTSAVVRQPILIVEDDQDTVAAIQMLLTDEGYAAIDASDAGRAIQALEQRNPALVLLDWSLDDGSGEAVLVAAKRGRASPLPVILMTGSSVRADSKGAADAVLRKPFEGGELLRMVARFYRP